MLELRAAPYLTNLRGSKSRYVLKAPIQGIGSPDIRQICKGVEVVAVWFNHGFCQPLLQHFASFDSSNVSGELASYASSTPQRQDLALEQPPSPPPGHPPANREPPPGPPPCDYPAEEALPLTLTPADLARCHPSRQPNFIRALRESGAAVLPVSENAEAAMPAYAEAYGTNGASEHVLLTFSKKGAQVVDMLMKWLRAKDQYLNAGIRAYLRVRLIPQLRLLNRECSQIWVTAAEKRSVS